MSIIQNKFNVGDSVTLKPVDAIHSRWYGINSQMMKFFGTTVTIVKVEKHTSPDFYIYRILEDAYNVYEEDWFVENTWHWEEL